MIYRNQSGQKLAVYAYTLTTGLPKTGDAGNITCYESIDWGAADQLDDVNPTELDATNMKGWYVFDLTQAETDGESLVFAPVSSTAGVVLDQVQIVTQASINQTGDAYARLGAPAGASVSADIAAIEAQTDDIGAAGAGLTALGDTRLANLDAAVSSRSTLTAADVWGYATRTLTSLSALLSSIAAAIWAYASRTLTQPAASVLAAVTGSTLNVVKSRTYDATLTGLTIQAAWTGVKFTAKTDAREPDSASLLQLVVSNPAAPTTDGALYVQGAAATPAQRLQGSLVVDQAAGTVALHLQDDLTALLALFDGRYDLTQYYTDGGETKSTQLTRGTWAVSATETGALA